MYLSPCHYYNAYFILYNSLDNYTRVVLVFEKLYFQNNYIKYLQNYFMWLTVENVQN